MGLRTPSEITTTPPVSAEPAAPSTPPPASSYAASISVPGREKLQALRSRLVGEKAAEAPAAPQAPASAATPAQEIESIKPPADSKDPLDQLAEDAERARESESKGLRIGAGVPGAAVFRATAGIGPVVRPTEIPTLLERAALLEQGLNPTQQQIYKDQLASVQTQAAEMQSRLEEIRNATLEDQSKKDMMLAVGEGLEMLGHNLTRLFAANYGLRKGVDMSGIRFDRYDWATAQSRYDKRFERALGAIDKQMEANVEALKEKTQGITKAQEKETEGMQKSAAELRSQAFQLEKQFQQQEFDAARTNTQMRVQDIQHQERMALELERIAAMRDRAELAAEARAAGKMDKAKALEQKNYDDAINTISRTIDEVVPIDEEFITDKEYQEVVKRLGQKTMAADVPLETIAPGIRQEGFFPWAQGKISKATLREKLMEMRSSGTPDSTTAPSSGMLNIDYADSADALD